MEFRHQFIDVSPYQRVFVIGDIHGKLDHLKHTLDAIEFDSLNDLLISVGDLIDRGPQSIETLEFYHQTPWFLSIAGNHELMMSNALSVWDLEDKTSEQRRLIEVWCKNGGDWSLTQPRATLEKLVNIVNQMPSAITCTLPDGRKVGISHAQPHSLVWEEMQNWQGDMMDNPRWIWGRTRIQGQPSEPVSGVDFTIHGHTRSDKVVRIANSYFIDTASRNDYTGEFTLLELYSGEFYSALTLTEWENL
ncbi:serine/threonine protein phosphatase [Vibrio nigripulchritudo]|uniref:metallophosphoesterase n=1 Tax=Vibrio nigripulchritudo TaxID=28173 RepID=UPI00190A3662|nr:metallophosphoesterase [Vibrio nigripulchritudo]BCL70177.1 serine/threonine protein phosphatase [Vibrio nigripulchritudo]BDU31527.1 serine/threonine protein phosphatase [Vibrio nigripulchritudo]